MIGRKRKIFNILAIVMVISMLAATVGAQPYKSGDSKQRYPELVQAEAVEVVPAKAINGVIGEIKGATEPAIYIVMFQDAPVATYAGGVEGLEATSAAAKGEAKLDVRSAASQAYESHLADEHAAFVGDLESLVGRSVDVKFEYFYAFNGMAVTLTPQEATEALALEGVAQIQRDYDSYIDTDAGPEWIGADHIWDGTATGGLDGTEGEGVLVGILDTGLNLAHPSFAETAVDTYTYTNPFGSGVFKGLCLDEPGTYICNDKTVGYYIYTGETGEDTDGHGSHTGSTTAGNHVEMSMLISASIDVGGSRYIDTINERVYRATISGVAPHANIIGYDVCDDDGGCPNSGSVMAIEQAVLDGVDVINFSIGGGASDPWSDTTSLAYLGAHAAGLIAVTSAGNSGPGEGTVGSPGNAPWMMTVGASFHNRAFPNALINMTGGDTTPPADIEGAGFSSGTVTSTIVYAGDFGDGACLTPFAAGTWTNNEIVVCDRAVIARVEKGVNVLAGGAGGYVLANANAGDTLNGDAHALPAVHILFDDGVALKTWLATGTGHTAVIRGSEVDFDPLNGDQMAGFSSRGPNTVLPDIIKPDTTGPGVDILAAYKTNAVAPADFQQEYGLVSGTSMSSPHLAGAAALMRALYPDWSVAEIISAIVSTGNFNVYKEDDATQADPFDFGGGYVDLTRAGDTALVLETTNADFVAANPALSGDPKSLNLATVANSMCLGQCTWTRTVRNTMSYTMPFDVGYGSPDFDLTAGPTQFTLGPDETQDIVITATMNALTEDVWSFGNVFVDPAPQRGDGENGYGIHFPVAVMGVSAVAPDLIEINTRRNAGSQLEEDLQGAEIYSFSASSYGLVEGTVVTELLPQDPTDDLPYDSPEGTFFVTVTVPSGAMRLVAETIESTAVDLDLFVGTGDTPSGATEECSSTTATAIEYCSIDDPAAGTWWILVQNWLASDVPPHEDTAVLSYAVVADSDAGNMTVEGPASNPAGTPFDITIFYNESSMEAGDRWYGEIALHDGERSPDQIVSIPVDLIRWEDDVSKEPSVADAEPGDTVTYTLTVQPNVTPVDLTYTITDTIPAGLTYVADSAYASSGEVSVVGDTVYWTGLVQSPFSAQGNYVVSDSVSDPLCDTGFGGYADLYGLTGGAIAAQAGIFGDTAAWTAFTTGDPIEFYGMPYTGFTITDDGFAIASFDDYDGFPWTPQSIPDTNKPNNVAALYWHDFEIFYDADLNHGVSLATSGFPGGVIIIEYDDIQLYGGGGSVMDMEIVMAREVVDIPGWYEVVYAYDNVSSTPSDATIGVENQPGDAAVAQVNNGDPSNLVTDGYMVCFDWVGPSFDPIAITYEVTVDPDECGDLLVNTAYHNTDNPGSVEDSVSAEVQLAQCAPTGVAISDLDGQNTAATMIPLLVALGGIALLAGAIAIRRREEA